MEVYWYISTTKVKMLLGTSLMSRLKEISVSLKPPWAEVGIKLQPGGDVFSDLKKVNKNLESEMRIRDFQDLTSGESPSVLSFSGTACRMCSDNAYWVTLKKDDTKLLLVGSPAHAIGASPTSQYGLSPSLDPLGAVEAVFRGQTPEQWQGPPISVCLEYVWSEVEQVSFNSAIRMPTVEGLALYAGAVDCDSVPEKTRIVLGSPIYIRQM